MAINMKTDISNDPNIGLSVKNDEGGLSLKTGVYTYSSGADNYNVLRNKPSIEGNVLIGDKSLDEIGVEEMSAAQAALLLT